MAVAQKVANYTLGQADVLRRVMGKKKKEELEKQFEGFRAGMLSNGYGEIAIKTLWEVLVPFADYAFNKAHSAGYGVLSYWTAYLKANFPAEFMAALLTSVGDSKDKLALYLSECRHMGIKVLAPDVNESNGAFSAVGNDIRFGLGAIRNVGSNVVEFVRSAREDKGRFTSFHDYLKKVPAAAASKKAVESLIKAGAFDSMGSTRRAILEIHEEAIDSAVSLKKNEAHGMVDLFGDMFEFEEATNVVPDRPEWSKREKLAFEREMLGLYVSDHPLAGLEIELAKHASLSIVDVLGDENLSDGEHVIVAGLLTEVERRTSKAGSLYARVTLEDFTGEITIMFMGRTYVEFGDLLMTDSVIAVKGRINRRDDGVTLHAHSLNVPQINATEPSSSLTLLVAESRATTDTLQAIKGVLDRHPGETEVRLRLTRAGTARVFELPYRIRVTPDFYGEIKTLLGPSCVAS
jgi:DNA polymerase-3 subunit alpha